MPIPPSNSDPSVWDVVVAPYDPAWPRIFEDVAAEIREACGDGIVGIEHVGSTSVPGLVAKPIIDVEVVVPSFESGYAFIPALQSIGYLSETMSPFSDWHSLWRPAAPGRLQVNLGISAPDHPGAQRKIAFRDYLRTHDDFAREYALLKRTLADRYAHDGSSYTGGKTGFIRRIRRAIEGRGPDVISVEPYELEWPARFEAEAARIRAATGDELLGIEHIGSTSVPGLPAKPIIDIMGLVPSFEKGRHLVVPIRRLGYLYFGENDIRGRHYFDLEDASGRDVIHLHLLAESSAEARNHILFRDYLRTHSDARDAYTALKHELIAKYANDRRTYTDAKADFIQEILAAAAGPHRPTSDG